MALHAAFEGVRTGGEGCATLVVAIVARNLLLAELLANYVEQLRHVRVVSATRDTAEFLVACEAHQPGIVIVDCGDPSMNAAFLGRVAKVAPGAEAFLVLHRSGGNEVAHVSMQFMNVTYVYWEDHSLATWRVALGSLRSRAVSLPAGDSPSRARMPRRGRSVLSSREGEVLRLVGAGLTNGEIAHRLGVKTTTVKTHLDRMAGKLRVRARASLVRVALEQGLLE